MIVLMRRRLAVAAAVVLAMLGVFGLAVPAAADPSPAPDSAQVTILEGVDFSKIDKGLISRFRKPGDFPSGNVYCPQWRSSRCLTPLSGSVVVKPGCGKFGGSNVDIRIFNPNWVEAPRNLYHLDASTGTGFGDDSFAPPGLSIFPIRNIPPGVYDFLVRWDDQNITFFQSLGVVLTCPSPLTP